jgi:hypothetical protein
MLKIYVKLYSHGVQKIQIHILTHHGLGDSQVSDNFYIAMSNLVQGAKYVSTTINNSISIEKQQHKLY